MAAAGPEATTTPTKVEVKEVAARRGSPFSGEFAIFRWWMSRSSFGGVHKWIKKMGITHQILGLY